MVHLDIYSSFLARCVMGNTHHLSHIAKMWSAQKPVLSQTVLLLDEPANIEPQGWITAFALLELVVCKR